MLIRSLTELDGACFLRGLSDLDLNEKLNGLDCGTQDIFLGIISDNGNFDIVVSIARDNGKFFGILSDSFGLATSITLDRVGINGYDYEGLPTKLLTLYCGLIVLDLDLIVLDLLGLVLLSDIRVNIGITRGDEFGNMYGEILSSFGKVSNDLSYNGGLLNVNITNFLIRNALGYKGLDLGDNSDFVLLDMKVDYDVLGALLYVNGGIRRRIIIGVLSRRPIRLTRDRFKR